MILVHPLRRHLQLVLHPKYIRPLALRLRLRFAKVLDELGRGDDLAQAAWVALDVGSVGGWKWKEEIKRIR